MTARVAPQPMARTVWVELILGDTDVTVVEFPDGLFALRLDDTQVLLNAEQMQAFVTGLKGLQTRWT
jgi:hypothetical protein